MAWARARRVQGKLVGIVMAWTRQGRLKNILSVEATPKFELDLCGQWRAKDALPWHDGLRQQCMWLNVVHVIQLRQGRLECWQGGLDQQGATDRCMAPIRRACKWWDDSARQWHGQELDGSKASLWALSWRGQGKEG
ncbi:hypothetical protein HAX54_036454 [Datura stramonium]|uniref:Uncharacterized protein n=1 Tax=Datura stramonium TaxID=4076 RepID=A0ABS8VGX0_DATST|nr:hypothetical protein [Datura stramonium]